MLDVRVRRVVDATRDMPALRSLEIRVGDEVIVTPARCATGYEMDMNPRHGLGIELENRVAVYARTIYRYDTIMLLADHDGPRKFVDGLAKFNAQDVPLRVCSLQIGDIAMGTPNPILECSDAQDHLVDALVHSQIKAGYDIVSVPHMGLNPEQAKSTPHVDDVPSSNVESRTAPDWLRKKLWCVKDEIESCHKQALLSIDMGYFAFADVLEYIVDELELNMVNILYRPPESAPVAYKCLRKYTHRNVAFLATNIPHANLADRQASTIHCMPFWGADLMALSTTRGFGYLERKNDTRKLQALDSCTIGLRPVSDHNDLARTIALETGIRDDSRARAILDELGDAPDDHGAYDRINSLLRLHELRVSTREMETLASAILEDGVDEYVGDRDNLASVIRPQIAA